MIVTFSLTYVYFQYLFYWATYVECDCFEKNKGKRNFNTLFILRNALNLSIPLKQIDLNFSKNGTIRVLVSKDKIDNQTGGRKCASQIQNNFHNKLMSILFFKNERLCSYWNLLFQTIYWIQIESVKIKKKVHDANHYHIDYYKI